LPSCSPLLRWRWGALAVFLDSLDQLDDTLPLDGLAPAVRLVVSTLPDARNPEVGRPFSCLSILTTRLRNAAALASAPPPPAQVTVAPSGNKR
jgi:hypothetical protein